MKRVPKAIIAALATLPLSGAFDSASANTITVSCFRGPLPVVAWDRPNPVFIDSLVRAGYSYETAAAMATRICTDESLVGNPNGLRVEMERLLRSEPRS
jgi:hypothetical protein